MRAPAIALPLQIRHEYQNFTIGRLDREAEALPLDLVWVQLPNGIRIFGIYWPHECGADFEQPGRVVRAREWTVLGILRRGRGWCEG